MRYRIFNKINEKVSLLGMGAMRLPETADGEVDEKEAIDIIRSSVDSGVNYVDTAYNYHGGKSEVIVGKALKDGYRQKVLLADKMPIWMAKDEDKMKEIFDTQLERLDVDCIDMYLVHSVNVPNWKRAKKLNLLPFLEEMKAQGKIRYIGFSFHDTAEALEHILQNHPEMEFVQLQMNYLDWESAEVQSRKCYEVASKHGKPVIVMEPVKGGTLADVPVEVRESFAAYHPDFSVPSWAIRFVASLDNVAMVLSGMSNMEQLMDNISYMKEFVPMNAEEIELVHKAAEMIKDSIAIPCTGCSYCTEGCPMQIAIPDLFRVYNKSKRGEISDVEADEEYRQLTEPGGKARECLACGQCQVACPQHLEIINYLKDVAKCMEKQD